jgi:hypothetical protein
MQTMQVESTRLCYCRGKVVQLAVGLLQGWCLGDLELILYPIDQLDE